MRRVPVLRRVPVERPRELVLRELVLRLRAEARPPRRAAAVLPAEPVRERADARPAFAAALRRVVLVERPVVLRLRDVVLRRVPVERAVVLRLRVVPVARRRAVVRPPFAAAAREGARRVVLRRVPVDVLRLRDVELRRRVPPLLLPLRELLPLDERDLLDELLERDVPVLEERRVVDRLRVPPDRAARTFSTPSSICCKPSDDCSLGCCCSSAGVSSEVVLNG